MKKVKKPEEAKPGAKQKATIEHYSSYKTTPMVRLKGNFYRGGFNISKNKVQAILDNIIELKKFAKGEYDEKIKELTEEEVLQP